MTLTQAMDASLERLARAAKARDEALAEYDGATNAALSAIASAGVEDARAFKLVEVAQMGFAVKGQVS